MKNGKFDVDSQKEFCESVAKDLGFDTVSEHRLRIYLTIRIRDDWINLCTLLPAVLDRQVHSSSSYSRYIDRCSHDYAVQGK